jgi:hypothetical protein
MKKIKPYVEFNPYQQEITNETKLDSPTQDSLIKGIYVLLHMV